MPISIVQGDIQNMNVDVIVNAANKDRIGGGGIDGAIHAAAGPGLAAECKQKYCNNGNETNWCPTGQVKLTGGHNLTAKHIIHTAGPQCITPGKPTKQEEQLLEDCYRNSINLALKNNFKSIAIPAISSGIFGYPADEAAKVAIRIMKEYEDKNIQIIACAYNAAAKKRYEDALAEYDKKAKLNTATSATPVDSAKKTKMSL